MNFSAASSSSAGGDALADLALEQLQRAHEDLAGRSHLVDLGRALLDDHSSSSRRSVASVARMWSWTSVGERGAVEAPQQAALLVVVDQRRGLGVVDLEATADRLRACRRRAGSAREPSWSQTPSCLGGSNSTW